MKILVTGAAGFIGSFVAERLSKDGYIVTGIDNLSDYYDVALKQARLARLREQSNFHFELMDITDNASITALFLKHRFDHVIHLAAQPGVQHSKEDPVGYVQANILGMLHILENCRLHKVKHLVYASSSSVYGEVSDGLIDEDGITGTPLSLYAATKKSNELMAHSYSHIYQLPTTGLRFFSVYGPWGRPDMAPFIFAKRILANQPVNIYGDGTEERTYTYIDDVVDAIAKIHLRYPKQQHKEENDQVLSIPYDIYNLSSSTSVRLNELISEIELRANVDASRCYLSPRSGDVKRISGDNSKVESNFGTIGKVSFSDGIGRFIDWFKQYYLLDDKKSDFSLQDDCYRSITHSTSCVVSKHVTLV